jgi:hypothetical protein
MHRAERDVRLLAVTTSAPHLRQRLLLSLRRGERVTLVTPNLAAA